MSVTSTQFRSNGPEATTRLGTEDAVLDSAHKLLEQARGLAISVSGRAPADPERQAMVGAIEKLRQELVSYGNTHLGNEYIFGGAYTTTPPFQADGTYLGDDTVHQVEVDRGVLIPGTTSGTSSSRTPCRVSPTSRRGCSPAPMPPSIRP